MAFIEDFYYGNIESQNYSSPEFGTELKMKLGELSKLEKQISVKLSGEEKDLFLKYTDKYIEFTARSLVDSFVSGFRFGAKFTHDTFITR